MIETPGVLNAYVLHTEPINYQREKKMDLAAGEDILNGNRVADGTSDAQKRRIAYYYDRIKLLHIVYQ